MVKKRLLTKKRILVWGFSLGVLFPILLFIGLSVLLYGTIGSASPNCGFVISSIGDDTPADFNRSGFDTTPYLVEDYEHVTFTPRDSDLILDGWYIPAAESDAPVVIISHGVRGCKRETAVLTAAGMLHNNGFNVLVFDFRDHGDSETEDGYHTGGAKEYMDVLGAWDWLISEKGIPPKRIGLMGFSLGAATATIAMGEEPRVAATWSDSSFAGVEDMIVDELSRAKMPAFLAKFAPILGRILTGDDIYSKPPIEAVEHIDGRPYFIVHGEKDGRIDVKYAYQLADAIRAEDGTEITPWIVPNAGHIVSIFIEPEEYEKRLIAFFRINLG